MNITLDKAFSFLQNHSVSLVGCGGKTSFINHMAQQHLDHKVLLLPTTKIHDRFPFPLTLLTGEDQWAAHTPQAGVQCMGVPLKGQHKLSAIPEGFWEKAVQGYDWVWMEADGSKGKFCKGWRGYEPVVPAFSDVVLGVVHLGALGQTICEENVHALSEFLQQTQAVPGDSIRLEHLRDMILSGQGMFRFSGKTNLLWINGAESPEALDRAQCLADMLYKEKPNLLNQCYAGSIRNNVCWRL